jgi:hypothetical protein
MLIYIFNTCSKDKNEMISLPLCTSYIYQLRIGINWLQYSVQIAVILTRMVRDPDEAHLAEHS